MNKEKEKILQKVWDETNVGYEEYKRNHPDFAKVVEEQLEGKTEEEFESKFEKENTEDQDWVKIGTIYGEMADKIAYILDLVGLLSYQERTVEGRMVLDVFTDKFQLELCTQNRRESCRLAGEQFEEKKIV